jgi:hypothetical protein
VRRGAAALAVGFWCWPPAAAVAAPTPDAGAGAAAAVAAPAPAPNSAPAPVPAPYVRAAATELEGGAAVLLAIRPTELGDGFAFVDLVGGVVPEVAGVFGRVRDAFGLTAFSGPELAERGIQPDALVLGSWGLVDAAAPAGRARAAAQPAYVRHRMVLQIADDAKLVAAAAAVLRRHTAELATVPARKPLPPWAKAAAAARPAEGVRLVGRGRGGELYLVRVRAGRAVVDWAEPFSGSGGRAARSARSLGQVLARMLAAPRRPLSGELGRAPRPLLVAPAASVAAVMSPTALARLDPRAECRDDWSSMGGALLDEVAVLFRLHPFDWKLELVWTLTPAGREALVTGKAAADDGLADGRGIASEGIAAGALLVSSLDAVAGPAATGTGALARRRLGRALAELDRCGTGAGLSAGLRFWPQALQAEATAALPALADAPRNVVAVLRDLPRPGTGWRSALAYLVSYPASAAGRLEAELGRGGAARSRQAFGDRNPQFFDLPAGGVFDEAGLEPIAGGHLGLALAPRGAGLGWYYRMRRRPARLGPQSQLGFLHVNVGRLLGAVAGDADAGTRSAVRLAASQIGLLGGPLVLEPDGALHLDLALSQ